MCRRSLTCPGAIVLKISSSELIPSITRNRSAILKVPLNLASESRASFLSELLEMLLVEVV